MNSLKIREKLILKIQKDILREYNFNPLPTIKRIKLEITKILQKLVDEIEDKDEFTAFRSAILQNFNEFVIDNEDILKAPLPNQAIMKEAAKEFADKYGLQLNL